MPSARVRTAMRVKPGDFRSWRKAKRRSFMAIFDFGFSIFDSKNSFGAKSNHGIDAGRPAGGDEAGNERDNSHHKRGAEKRPDGQRRHAKENALHRPAGGPCASYTEDGPSGEKAQA